jgi:AmmeMemoRadiSam system protein B
VAGTFYPADPDTLAAEVDRFLEDAAPYAGPAPKALIAPHAGYIYSGPVAASAYAALRKVADRIHRVVVLAPSHRVAFRGIATTTADRFRTPLGDIPVDTEALRQATGLPQVGILEQAFQGEHALEVQLPFLQRLLPDFRLAPFVVGDTRPEEVAQLIDLLWGGEETLFVISSDLSHYHDYATARQRDRATSRQIEALDTHLDHEDACGRNPIQGLLLAAREHELQAETRDLRNSGDTAGPRDRVVGYGAYVFH